MNYLYGIGALIAVLYVLRIIKNSKKVSITGKTILVTGCDSGFGELVSLRMDKLGFKVYSACLFEESCKKLMGQAPNITAFKCDITVQADIDAAVKLMQSDPKMKNGLWCVINNAGIAASGPVEWTPLSEYRKVLDVNFLGHVAVTKAVMPLIRKAKGRVVNVTSMAGVISLGLMSAYSCSKYALEAFSDALRREVSPFGVKVCIIEPSFMRTPLTSVDFYAIACKKYDGLDAELKQVYNASFLTKMKKNMAKMHEIMGDPVMVIDVLEHAATSVAPKTRYPVGKGIILGTAASFIPTSVIDWLILTLG